LPDRLRRHYFRSPKEKPAKEAISRPQNAASQRQIAQSVGDPSFDQYFYFDN
jgi:hypothetical protein